MKLVTKEKEGKQAVSITDSETPMLFTAERNEKDRNSLTMDSGSSEVFLYEAHIKATIITHS